MEEQRVNFVYHLKQQYYISIDIDSYILFWNLHRLILKMADFIYSLVYLIEQFTEEAASKISFHVILHFIGLSTTIKGLETQDKCLPTTTTRRLLYNTLFLLHLDYCSVVFNTIPL